jgi:hypothetical protein
LRSHKRVEALRRHAQWATFAAFRDVGLGLSMVAAKEDVYICPAGEKFGYSFKTQEHGLMLRRYLTNACQRCAIKHRCTTAKERRITRWEHENIVEAVQRRLDEHPEKMR